MNPLTQIRNTQLATRREIELGLDEKGSWHDRYKHSAYVYAGGLSYELTEGDVLAVFSQYGEIVDVHLVRDKKTKKSRGFAFLAYEDQRSTVLAVDNLSGSRVAGRIIRVEHVDNYRKQKAEVEGEEYTSDADVDDQRIIVEEAPEEDVIEHRREQDIIEENNEPSRSKKPAVPSWRDLVARREQALEQEKEKEKKKKKKRRRRDE
mmetsp:Transcript_7046/g.14064  ORF Transcript_7046/g.14064 Transcript_7046/m.14064 type:complete len:206 (+) Transcript_7046:247-864(+)